MGRETTGASAGSRALIVAAWLALGLTLVRGTLLFGMDRVAHGHDFAQTQVRLATALPGIVIRASVLASVAAALVTLVSRSTKTRRSGLALVLLLTSLAGVWFLAGWVTGDASRAVGLDTSRGRTVATVLALVALVLTSSAFLVLLGRGPRFAAPVPWLSVPVLLLALAPIGWQLGFSALEERMTVRETVVDLLAGEATWKVVGEREGTPPRVGSVSPSTHYTERGADMPTLILPPPSEVVLRAPDGHGPLVLNARAGIDHRLIGADFEHLRGTRVRFLVSVAGAERARLDIPIESTGRFPGTEWELVGGDEGLWIASGDEVRLSTRLLDTQGNELEPSEELPVGFGGLSFERRWLTDRMLATPQQPNVILIVMDTLRADRMDAYGYELPTTPKVSELAARGVLYERAFSSASWTWPSTASILTGKLPQEHGVEDEGSAFLSGIHTTLAEALQRQGLTTAAFSANVLIVPDKNFDQGFELFDHGEGGTRSSEVVVPRALEWIEATAPTRFFLYLHLADPHAPLDPLPEGRALFAADVPAELPARRINEHQRELLKGCGHTPEGRPELELCVPPEEQRWIRQLYDACVWSGDHQVGRVLALLERLGIADRTVVAFTSDHGEELYDHGFATHGHALFDELVHVPLVLAGPGLPQGVRVSSPVSNRHLAPTLAGLAGADFGGAGDPIDLSRPELVRELGGEEILTSTANGWWNGRIQTRLLGLRQGSLSLHFAPQGGTWGSESPSPQGDWRLYDMASDPEETRDLAAQRQEDADRLRALLLQRLAELAERRPDSPTLQAGAATLERLRAIGYVGD